MRIAVSSSSFSLGNSTQPFDLNDAFSCPGLGGRLLRLNSPQHARPSPFCYEFHAVSLQLSNNALADILTGRHEVSRSAGVNCCGK